MIVKNEVGTINKTLASMRDMIDYWTLVDTGSTDGTQVLYLSVDSILDTAGTWQVRLILERMLFNRTPSGKAWRATQEICMRSPLLTSPLPATMPCR